MEQVVATTDRIICRVCNHDGAIGEPCRNCGHFTCPECNIPLIHRKYWRNEYQCVRCKSIYGVRLVVRTEHGMVLAYPERGN